MDSIIIAAGGTGGHIYPGIAVGSKLRDLGFNVVWVGTKLGMEAGIVKRHHFKFLSITIKGVRRSGPLRVLSAPMLILLAISQAVLIIKRVNPKVIIGMGGYVSGPVGVAAKLCGKKLVIHEQNSVAGLTNRLLSILADRTLQAFPGTFKKETNAITTGNPIRSSISSLPSPEVRIRGRTHLSLLIFGGSRGARIINNIVPLGVVQCGLNNLSILHQTGSGNGSSLSQSYAGLNSTCHVEVVEYIDDMSSAYHEADLVIARAGAVTVSELMAVGVASVLIPFAGAVDNHQLMNAAHLAEAGASITLSEQELTASKITAIVGELLSDRERLLSMANSARVLGFKDSLSLVVNNSVRF